MKFIEIFQSSFMRDHSRMAQWLNNLRDIVIASRLSVDTEYLTLNGTPNGQLLRYRGPLGGAGGAAGVDSAAYAGPFNVIKKDNTTVTVGKDAFNIVFLGQTDAAMSETDIAVTASGFIGLKITFSGSAYTYVFKHYTTFPAQTATEFYIPLAYVTVASSAISRIEQLQYGNIVQSGRIL